MWELRLKPGQGSEHLLTYILVALMVKNKNQKALRHLLLKPVQLTLSLSKMFQ